MPELQTILALAVTIGAALVGGVFFAFSFLVMPGLAAVPAATGIESMRSINVVAVRPTFMTLLFGTGALGIAACFAEGNPWSIAGAAVYLIGALGVTVGFLVPRNDSLAVGAVDIEEWTRYLREWTAGNHVRAAAGGATAVLSGISAAS